MPAVDQVQWLQWLWVQTLGMCRDFIGHECILRSAFRFVNLWSWVLFCPCFVSLSADPIEDPWCWDRSLKKKTAANWNRPASEVQVADVCGVDSSFFNACFCDNVLSYRGSENALFISIATRFLSFIFWTNFTDVRKIFVLSYTTDSVRVCLCALHHCKSPWLSCSAPYRRIGAGEI